MKSLAWSYTAAYVIGRFTPSGGDRPARFLGVELPGSVAQQAVTVGTPLRAPPLMVIALLAAAHRGRGDDAGRLAVLFMIGVLGEKDTWTTLRWPIRDPIATAFVVLDTALPARAFCPR